MRYFIKLTLLIFLFGCYQTPTPSNQVGSNSNTGNNSRYFTTQCKKACVKGVETDIIVGIDFSGNYIFFKNISTGELIDEPDFNETCPPLECTKRAQTLCADGDYGDIGISDGDALILTIQECNNGKTTITGATTLSNPTVSVNLPNDIVFKSCSSEIETELIGCVTDEKGEFWNTILVDGTTIVYQSQTNNQFGTPNGDVVNGCGNTLEIVGVLDDKHCILVEGDTIESFIYVNSDKSHCANPVGTTTYYDEGDYKMVSCCGNADQVSETQYLNAFDVRRPTDTPNTGWNNQVTGNTTPIVGDFELCFTVNSATANTPNMIGINSDPTTNASYQSIDCALCLYNANTSYLLRDYRNGAFIGTFNSTSWVGSEICYQRIGADLFYKQNGTVLNPTNPCSIGTGTVFLDDSHYFANGFWGTGSISYSDFNIVTRIEGDSEIKSKSECVECCDGSTPSSVRWSDISGIPSGFADGVDDNETVTFTSTSDLMGFASGNGWNNGVENEYGCRVVNIGNGRFNVVFNTPHPLGDRYDVLDGSTESFNTRDNPKTPVVEGTQTATGFQIMVTVDDNGGTADILSPKGWSFFVPVERNYINSITIN